MAGLLINWGCGVLPSSFYFLYKILNKIFWYLFLFDVYISLAGNVNAPPKKHISAEKKNKTVLLVGSIFYLHQRVTSFGLIRFMSSFCSTEIVITMDTSSPPPMLRQEKQQYYCYHLIFRFLVFSSSINLIRFVLCDIPVYFCFAFSNHTINIF